jgi:hypothetical protein
MSGLTLVTPGEEFHLATRERASIFRASKPVRPAEPAVPADVLSEATFHRIIARERKRSERSQRPFVLLLIDTGGDQPGSNQGRLLLDLLAAIEEATRETDVTGWYTTDAVVGVMFTEIVLDNKCRAEHDPFPHRRGRARPARHRSVQPGQVFLPRVSGGLGSGGSRPAE